MFALSSCLSCVFPPVDIDVPVDFVHDCAALLSGVPAWSWFLPVWPWLALDRVDHRPWPHSGLQLLRQVKAKAPHLGGKVQFPLRTGHFHHAQ